MIKTTLALLLFLPLAAEASKSNVTQFIFEDFDKYATGRFPNNWKPRGWKHKAARVYKVREENGNRFLKAVDRGEDMQIGKYHSWNPKEFPVLSFRWRAHKLPKGASENNTKTNDSAAGIYVVFKGGWFIPPGLKYVWSSSLPVADSNISYKDKLKVIVLQTGKDRLGQWTTHEVNYIEHYQKYFKTKKMPKIQGIAILTDANATKSIAEADYDDFVLKRKMTAKPAKGKPSYVSFKSLLPPKPKPAPKKKKRKRKGP